MNRSRRKFARLMVLSAAAPLAPLQAQQEKPSADSLDVAVKSLGAIPMNEERAGQVRQSIEQSVDRVGRLRKYNLRREIEPALGLGIFDL